MKKKLFRLTGILVMAVMLVSAFAVAGFATDADDNEVYSDTSADDAKFVTQFLPDSAGFDLREAAAETNTTQTTNETTKWTKYDAPSSNYQRLPITSAFHFGSTNVGTGGRSIKSPFVFACDVKLPTDYSGDISFVVIKSENNAYKSIPVYLGINNGEFYIHSIGADRNFSNGITAVKLASPLSNPHLSDKWYGYAGDGIRRKFARVYLYLDPFTGKGSAKVRQYLVAADGSLDTYVTDSAVFEFEIADSQKLTAYDVTATDNTNAKNYSIALFNTAKTASSIEIRNAKIYVSETTIFEKPTIELTDGKARASATFYDFSYSGAVHNIYPLITAVYNHDTKEIVKVESKVQDIQRGNGFFNFGTKVAEKDVNLSALSDGVYDVKAFVWKSLADIMPKTSASAVKTYKVETGDNGKTITELTTD